MWVGCGFTQASSRQSDAPVVCWIVWSISWVHECKSLTPTYVLLLVTLHDCSLCHVQTGESQWTMPWDFVHIVHMPAGSTAPAAGGPARRHSTSTEGARRNSGHSERGASVSRSPKRKSAPGMQQARRQSVQVEPEEAPPLQATERGDHGKPRASGVKMGLFL